MADAYKETLDKMREQLNKDDFSQWYNDVIELANLSDKRYAVKGMNVWTPYGWKLMKRVDHYLRKELDSTGHDEVCFPLLIPKTEFAKEAEHIKGFDSEVYWVTHGGLNELDVPLLLRPTSETAMYPMFALWIRSHNDLPLKIYQLVNTFRYETKQTRTFIRVREIHFFEAHTAHADLEDAERQIMEDLNIMKGLSRSLCLPYLLSRRPEWDKFAGAYYTIGIDCLMPNGKTLQLGSIHQYRENFSRPYEIMYEDTNGEHRYVHQTTYGMSERIVGAVVGIHGDDRGIIIPPDIAPYQVVVVPIYVKGKQEMVNSSSRELYDQLTEAGIRCHLDDRDLRPGNKFYDWELKGVPVRVELGPRDIASGSCVLVRRDDGSKWSAPLEGIASAVRELLGEISVSMYERAVRELEANIHVVMDTRDALDDKGETIRGVLKMPWCGSEDCAGEIEKDLDRILLGYPVDTSAPDLEHMGEGEASNCIICGKPTNSWTYAAKSY